MAGMYGCFKSRNSDSAAMASGPPDVTVNQEPAEAAEECSGKKKSKFQTFKKFFARKKRKDPPAAGADAGLKASQSSDNVSKTSENNTLTRSEKDKGSGSKISLGSKALSHDSVFVSDSSEANEALGASQDSIHGKVKSLQLQLKQAIRLGSPPSLMCVKKTEDGGTMSEDDGLPCSPPEYTTHSHTAMNQPQRNSSNSMEGVDSDDDQLSRAASSRAVSPLVVPGDFSQPASPFGCLDNSAAKHKLGLRNKACNKRKPISRLELKAEGDSAVETLNTSITEAPVELEQQKAAEVVSDDEPKPKVEKEEEEGEEGEAEQEKEEEEEDEKEEEEEEEEKPQHSRQSLLRDKEEREETEDESETERDVSHARDTSSSPELCLSEEEAPDAQPSPSSKPSSRASSLDSPGATPEPPAGPREYLLDPAGITYEVEENRAECDLTLREEEDDDDVQETREEESSFLQEVLSSLKTPLSSCSLGVETEGVVLEIEEEVKDKEGEDVEVEEGEEVKEEEAEVDEPVSYHAAPAGSLLSDQTTEEDEEEEVATLSAPSCQDVQEEKRDEEEEEAEEEEEEEEEPVVERFSQHGQKEEGDEEEVEEVKPENQNETLTGDAVNQPEEGGSGEEESEGEEEAIELELEPEVEVEGREKMEEDNEDVEEAKERAEEAEEAIEEEKDNTEEMVEVLPGAEGQEVAMDLQEADEGVDVAFGDITVCTQQLTKDDEIPAELGDQVLVAMHETSSPSFEEEREERVEEGVEINHTVPEMEQEDDAEENQPDVGQSDQDVEQEGEEISYLNTKQVEKDQTEEATEQAHASSKPSPLSLPESHYETPSQDSGAITPSKTSTTTLHINLISPSSEKVTSFFQQSPTAAYANSEAPSHALAATVQNTASTEEEEEEEEPTDTVQTVEALEEEATPPTSVEETAKQLSSGSDQSKVRFTIAPAWQRSLSVEDVKESLTSPSSPPACASSSPEVEATTKKDPEVKAEPASSSKVEVVLSPGRGRNAGITTAKPQSNATTPPSSSKPQTSAAASTEESSVVVEGNPDNPFGVRLRKTSVLHRFSSEEESPEHPTTTEPPAQPPSCKVDAPQPISAKPSISQPVSNKPALPKKPDVHGDSAAKNKRISDPAAARGVSAGSDSPSWISMAKQKQKIYKENSVEEITVKKEEQEKKSPLPTPVSREPPSKASPVEISKPSASVEKEARRALSPSAPVPSQPPKTQSLPCSIPPKPQVPPTTAKPQRSLSPPTPVPVAQKSPSCTNPPSLPKTATSSKTPQAQSTTVTSPPFSSRTAPEKSASRAPGLSSQTPSSQRGMPPPALPQDEPPWMALAKKKAKAWSEMPQIVQ